MRGFTLLELLVVISIIAILVILLLPAIQSSRETARRTVCQGNLQQIGIALHNHVATHGRFPIGASSGTLGTMGVSWWVAILPFLEESIIFAEVDSESVHNGFLLMNARNGQLVDGIVIDNMICPSSPLPHLRRLGPYQVMMPSYVGIAGASSDDSFPEARVSPCCVPQVDGEMSAGGLFHPNGFVKFGDIMDGASKTLAVGESSDFALYDDRIEFRVDGGYPLGWLAGAATVGTPPNYLLPYPSWNITTVRHPVDARNYDLPGVHRNRGPNNPLLAAHPGGVHGLQADGSVSFLSDNLDVATLKSLATRDDGRRIAGDF